MSANVAVVDLFCGVGGLTCGLKKAGLDVVAGIDNDVTCRYAYEENNKTKFIEADIADFSGADVDKLFGNANIKILVGCAPCQRFSKQANKYRRNIDTATDIRWNLLKSFAKYIEEIQPDIVSMENVPELRKFDIFEQFKSNLESLNYHVSYKVVDCSKYGLPQKRRRLVLLASKHSDIELISEMDVKEKSTVRDVLEKLPKLSSGEVNSKDPLHRSAGLTDINLKRIKQSKPGGTWRDWDKSLLPECYKKPSGKSYSSVYGRMKWDEPSPTITTQFYSYGTGRYGHPEQDRALSLREGALLQTFPDNYKFFENLENVSIGTISRHIGNAVPVDLGKIIGMSINKHLEKMNNDQ
jgi:DNA (cytosine-5)-methyltransferase 1